MNAARIAIGLRIGHAPDAAFFVSWTRLLTGGIRAGDVVLDPAVGMPHAPACNALVQRFLETPADALLFIDDDMVFTPASLETLRRTESDHGILSALYTTRRPPVRPIVLHKTPTGYAPRKPQDCHGLVTCDVVGLGFTLISRPVIEAAADAQGPDGVFTWDNTLGEDGTFCVNARNLGHSVGVNCDVIVGHRVTYTATWSTAENAVVMDTETYGLNPGKE